VKYNGHVKAVSFTNKVYKYMAVSDFAVTKTGGLTTSEYLAMGLPIISVYPIPGQEERNTHYILENGAGLRAYDEVGLIYRVNKLLKDEMLLGQMQNNALSISKPRASFDIHKIISDYLLKKIA